MERQWWLEKRLKDLNRHLVNVHCCHKPSLACYDINDGLAYVQEVERWLFQLWKFFDNSYKRLAQKRLANQWHRQESLFPNTPSSILLATMWTWHFKHSIYATRIPFPLLIIFVMVFTSCGKWLGWNILQRLASRWSKRNFFHINKSYCCVSC